jgi:hypothetical protein
MDSILEYDDYSVDESFTSTGKQTISQIFDSPYLSENEKFQAIANQENIANYSVPKSTSVDYERNENNIAEKKRPRVTKYSKPLDNAFPKCNLHHICNNKAILNFYRY